MTSDTTPAPSASSSPSAPPATAVAPARSGASLKKALLTIDEMPAGFSEEPPGDSDNGGQVISSTNPKCRPLVAILKATTAPGSTASASTSFSGGQDGPFIDQSLSAMGSAARVTALHASIRTAVEACSKVTLRLQGGRSTMMVRTVRAPQASSDAVAFRITADGGDLDGLEATQVSASVGDVDLTMVFFGAYPEEIEGATQDAHDKAADVLDVTAPAVS
jgi:hypothetical protein